MRMALTGLGVLLLVGIASARELYVSPEGLPDAPGTRAAPLDLATALTDAQRIAPGDTIWLLAGTYQGPFEQNAALNGTAEQPIIYRALPGVRATITAAAEVQHVLTLQGSHTWLWGVEVTVGGDLPPRRGGAVWLAGGDGVKLINLIIHDNPDRSGIGAWDIGNDHEITGCLLYRNGRDTRAQSHGIYTQNTKAHTTKTFRECLIFNNFGWGMHGYAEEKAQANFRFEGCVLYGNGLPVGSALPVVNFLLGGHKDANQIQVDHCYTYFPQQAHIVGGGDVQQAVAAAIAQGGGSAGRFKRGADFGYIAKNNGTLAIRHSVFVGGLNAVEIKNWHRLTFTDNRCYTHTGYGLMMTSPQGDDPFYVAPKGDAVMDFLEEPQAAPNLRYDPRRSELDRNTYFAEGAPSSRHIYRDGRSFDSLADWQQATGWGAHSEFVSTAPQEAWVYLRPNPYELDRAHLIIYNWPGASTIPLDLAQLWQAKPGERFRFINVEDYWGAPVLETPWTGQPITLPLAGSFAPQFVCYVVLRER